MTLSRLVLAWLPVTLWFLLARVAAVRWLAAPGPAPTLRGWTALRTAAPQAAEAVGVTLFASLWFDSLGAGGWWLLFLLLGALVTAAPRLRDAAPGPSRAGTVILGLADVARYVVAGGLLAWRLG